MILSSLIFILGSFVIQSDQDIATILINKHKSQYIEVSTKLQIIQNNLLFSMVQLSVNIQYLLFTISMRDIIEITLFKRCDSKQKQLAIIYFLLVVHTQSVFNLFMYFACEIKKIYVHGRNHFKYFYMHFTIFSQNKYNL